MIVLARKYGRLGNRLFNAAHVMAFAIEQKQVFANLSFGEYAEFFEGTHRDFLCRFPPEPHATQGKPAMAAGLYRICNLAANVIYRLAPFVRRSNIARISVVRPVVDGKQDELNVDPKTLPIDWNRPFQLVLFQGWLFRSFDALRLHGDTVRAHFTPVQPYRQAVAAYIAQHREGYDFLIGIVIRHGDYKTWQGGKFFYPVEQYIALMRQVRQLLGNSKVKFLVFSDDRQDESLFTAEGFHFDFRSGHMIENLYALAECDRILTPPSTYGMWASFYGKKLLYVVEDPSLPVCAESFQVCEG